MATRQNSVDMIILRNQLYALASSKTFARTIENLSRSVGRGNVFCPGAIQTNTLNGISSNGGYRICRSTNNFPERENPGSVAQQTIFPSARILMGNNYDLSTHSYPQFFPSYPERKIKYGSVVNKFTNPHLLDSNDQIRKLHLPELASDPARNERSFATNSRCQRFFGRANEQIKGLQSEP